MLRSLYGVCVRLHPPDFRERYGSEMLEIYDEAANGRERAWLLGDVVVSAFRQRYLRAPAPAASAALPLLLAVNDARPSMLALTQGGAATLLAWGGLIALLTAGAHRPIEPAWFPRIAAGASLPHLIEQPWMPPHPLLALLDADGDKRLSAIEIEQASQLLSRLDRDVRVCCTIFDRNRDAVLSLEEARSAPRILARLDRDGDGFVTFDELPG